MKREKECGFFIRVCNERCSDCYDSDISENNHQCKECKDGYYPVKDTYNCVTKEEMIGTVYSFDEKENIFKISIILGNSSAQVKFIIK